jgi:hypothetical protein
LDGKDKGWDALHQVHGMIEQLKKATPGQKVLADVQVKVSYLSSRIVPCTSPSGFSLEDVLQVLTHATCFPTNLLGPFCY